MSRGKKPRSKSGRKGVQTALLMAPAALLAGAVQAATVQWSPSGVNSGGTGTWDGAASTWWNGTVALPWNNLNGDSAEFGGTAGTVTLNGAFTVQDLIFKTDGYTLQGGTITLASGASRINVGSGNTATVNSTIAGAGRVDVMGGGTTVLGGTNTYTGGTTVSGNSTLRIGSDSNLGAAAGALTLGDATTGGILQATASLTSSRNITLGAGGGTLNTAAGNTTTLGGVISGSGNLSALGGGTLLLTGNNTYTGITTLATGNTLSVGNGGTTGALGTGALTNNGALIFNRSNAYTYAGAISGTGTVQKTGGGATTLSGNNTYVGTTTVSAGTLILTGSNSSTAGATIDSGATLQIGNNAASGSIGGNIVDNGTLVFARNDNHTFSGIISGTGAVQRTNGNWLTLSGANTYSGGTLIGGGGGVYIANDGNLGAAGAGITFNSGTGYLSSTANLTTARAIMVNSGATGYTGSTSGTLILDGLISGAGSFGVNQGTVIVTNANTYSGGTTIAGGTLQVSNDANLGAAAGGVTFTGGGYLRAASSFATSRNIAMNAAANIDAYNGSTLTLNGKISGGGTLYFYGNGTSGGKVILTGTNTNTGGMNFWTGSRVEVSSDANLGAASGALGFSNGTLATTSSFTTARNVSLSAAGTFDVAVGTTLTESGVISGGGSLVKSNTGTLVLTGTNTNTGGTTINAGTLQVGNGGISGTLGSTNSTYTTSGTGNVTNKGTLAINRSDTYTHSGVISSTGAFQQVGSGTTVLTGNNTYTGATQVAAGSLYINGNQTSATGLTTVDSGATLGGSGTIGGSVTIADGGVLAPGASNGAAGTLNIKGGLNLASGSILNYQLGQADVVGGTLNDQVIVGGNLTLDGTLNVNTTPGGSFDAGVYRIISYTGALTNNGLNLGSMPSGANASVQTSVAGQVNLVNALANASFWDGASLHSNSQVNGGSGIWNTGSGANDNWTDASGGVNAAYAPSFAIFQGTGGTVTVDNTGGQVAASGLQFATNGYVVNGGAIDLTETTSGTGQTTVRVGDGTGAGSGYTATIGSVLQGNIRLAKSDQGTLVLTGDNTYSGGTSVVGGTLQLGDGGTSGSILGDVANNTTLAVKRSDTYALGGIVSGLGQLRQIGTGTTVLTGANTYTGTTTISSGTLQVGDGGTVGTLGTGAVVNNATLAFNRSNQYIHGTVISGSGALRQIGTGETVLTNANTYTGGTFIDQGKLTLGVARDAQNNVISRGAIVGNVVDNGTLSFNRDDSYTFNGAISGNGGVEQQGGTLTLGGANTYHGDTLLKGGRLIVSSDSNLGDAASSLVFNGGQLQTNATVARHIDVQSGGGMVVSSNATFNGNITGTGQLNFYGGTNTLNGDNSGFSGTVHVGESATIVVSKASALGTGTILGQSYDTTYGTGGKIRTTADMTVANNIQFGFPSFYGDANWHSLGFSTDAGTTLTLTGNIDQVGGYRGHKGIFKEGAGTLVLANAVYNDGGYAFWLNQGTLQVGNGATRGTLGNAPLITASGTQAIFDRTDTSVYGGTISGTGSVEQRGAGTTVFTADSTHTGGTTISAGTLQLGNGGATGSVTGNITNNGTLAINHNNAFTLANNVSGSGALVQRGTGTTIVTGTNTYTGGTSIAGGILQIGNGGTSGSIVGDITGTGGALAVNRSDALTLGGTISGSTGFTQMGSGSTTLTGNNTYTGATTVSAGKLYIEGDQSAATGATTVASGTTLGGKGTIGGNVTIANGANFNPGGSDGTGGTLTIKGNLTLNDSTQVNYTLGKVNGVDKSSLTNVGGNLTLDGRLNVQVTPGGTFDVGLYRLFNYNGALVNNGLVLGDLPAATTVALQTGVAGQVNLVNSTGVLLALWDGSQSSNYNNGIGDGGSGIWDRAPGHTNWSDASGSVNNVYTPTSYAVFQGASGTVTVDRSKGAISAGGLQFAVDGYTVKGDQIDLVETLAGSGSTTLRVGDGSLASAGFKATIDSVLAGTTRLTKTDLGKAVLTADNTYSGGTAINGGTLSISKDSNLGTAAGGLSFDGGTLESTASITTNRATTLNTNGGTLDVDSGTILTLGGAIAGTGSLTKTDAGTLLLTGTNAYSGGTAFNGGVTRVSSDTNLGAAAGQQSFDGGTLETTATMSSARATTLAAGGGTFDVDTGTTLTESGVISGSGALTKTDAGTLVLSGANTYTGGTAINGGTVRISSDASLGDAAGAVSLNGATLETTASMTSARNISLSSTGGTFDVNAGTTLTENGVIAGAGSLTKTDTGTLVLSGANTYTGGSTISSGKMKLTRAAAAGTGTVNVATTAADTTQGLELALASAGTFANTLQGAGMTTVSGARTTVTGTNSAYTGDWKVSGALAVANTAATSTTNLGTGQVAIDTTGSVELHTAGAFSFDNELLGSGTLDAANGGQAFNFGANVGDAFTGTVRLADNTFALSGDNTTALTHATLDILAGNVTTVGAGTQAIGNLTLDGGVLAFTGAPTGTIDTGALALNSGDVRLNPNNAGSTGNLLAQDEGVRQRLISATAVTGSADNLALKDSAGNLLTTGQSNIVQGGNTVAVGSYGYDLATSDMGSTVNDGLYAEYHLTQLALQAGQTTSLSSDTTATTGADELHAKITGSGNLAIDATNTITLSNTGNDYTGTTSVNAGTLKAGTNNALGQTRSLSVADTATFDLNGKTQTIGALDGQSGSTVNLNGGQLTLTNGGTSAGSLTGAGQLNVNGGTLAVTGANTGLSASTAIASGATVSLDNVDGLGSSAINTSGTLQLDGATGTLDNAIAGTGTVSLENGADVTLSGTNSLSGTWSTASGTTLTASAAAQLGTAVIDNAGAFQVDTSTNWTLANAMSGAGSFTKLGSGDLTIDRANTGMTGDTTIAGGTLKLTNADAIGSGAVSIDTTAADATQGLELALASAGTFANTLQGAGMTTVSGAKATVTGANSGYTGDWKVSGALAVANTATTSTTNLGTGQVAIDATGSVNLHTNGAFSFDNELVGSGTLDAANGGQAFDFGTSVGDAFAGLVKLADNTFALSGDNTTALTHATLEVLAGNETTVGDGDQKIHGLTLNGGTMIFNATAPEQTVATSTITTDVLDTSHAGSVRINVPTPYAPSAQYTDNSRNLLEQDEGNVGVKLVNATSVIGSAGALTLADATGQAISAGRSVDIEQSGATVAKGTYDYRLTTTGTTGAQDGLYVNYGLTALELLAGQTLTLAEDTGAIGVAADMSAKITGTGNLAIDAGAGVVSLSNATNNYTGTTAVTAGTLRAEADNALGQTRSLSVADTATFDLNGKTQTVGALDGQSGSTVDLKDGQLTLTNGGTSAGTLTGAGQLSLLGGTLDVQGANTGLSASTSIASGATAHLDSLLGMGSGAIADNGTLELDGTTGTLANDVSGAGSVNLSNAADVILGGDNSAFSGTFGVASGTSLTAAEAQHLGTASVDNAGQLVIDNSTDWTLDNLVSGVGNLIKKGLGTLSAGDQLNYTGTTDIQAGTLIVGDATNPNVTLGGPKASALRVAAAASTSAGDVNVASGATLAGLGTVSGHVNNSGTVAALNALPGRANDPVGTFTLASGLTNAGVVNLAGGSVGNQLLVQGDYVGNNGEVVLNTVKGADNAATDKLVIDGGNASGSTTLVIKHAGGNGAQTTQGIRVVETLNGGTTDATAFSLSTRSDGYRSGAGTLAAGAYDYALLRGGNGGVANDWYLSSTTPPVDPVDPAAPVDPVDPANPATPSNPTHPVSPKAQPEYRPEVQSYMDNRVFAQNMQFHTLHDRQIQTPGMVGDEPSKVGDGNGWLRVVGKDSSRDGALDTSEDSYLIHGGADFAAFSDGGDGSVHFGAMGSYGHNDSHAHNSKLSSDGKVEGYSVGLYGTWYGNQDILTGPYVDSWVMYGRFDNTVKGQGLAKETYDSSNLAASLETGYSIPVYESQSGRAFIEPQAQVIVSDYRADNHKEKNGTQVSGLSSTDVTTRLGVRVHGDIKAPDSGATQLQPFAEVNWWHGPDDQSASFDGTKVHDRLPGDRLETKVGIQGNVTKAVSVWTAASHEVGSNDYRSTGVQLGVKYTW